MKKMVLAFVLCLLLVCITACGNDSGSKVTSDHAMEFASSEEMLQYLEGMWVAEDNAEDKTYYIFQNGQVYILTDAMYTEEMLSTLDRVMQINDVKDYNVDFEELSKEMNLTNVCVAPDSISFFPEKGEVKMNSENSQEISIIITEMSVSLKTGNSGEAMKMSKISDAMDASPEYFENAYTEALDRYMVHTDPLWMDFEEYAEIIKATIPNFDSWKKTTNGYSYSQSNLAGQMIFTDVAVLLKHWETLTMPQKKLEIMCKELKVTVDKQDSSMDVEDISLLVIQYGLHAVRDYPGAYIDAAKLYDDIHKYGTVPDTSGYSTLEYTTENGLTYTLCMRGTSAYFEITAADEAPLRYLLNNENSIRTPE